MTTESAAVETFKFWCDKVYALEKMTFAVQMKADGVATNEHLRELQRARVAKQQAHEELRAVRGSGKPTRPVNLRLRQPVKLIPTMTTADFVRHLQLKKLGQKYTGPKQFYWRPASEAEAKEVCQRFGLGHFKKGCIQPKGFSVRKVA
jgi:hypothetical protein